MRLLNMIVYNFLSVIMFLMIARALMSWFVRDIQNETFRKIFQFLYEVTEPLLGPARMLLQKLNIGGGMMDFSFLLTYFVCILLRGFFRY